MIDNLNDVLYYGYEPACDGAGIPPDVRDSLRQENPDYPESILKERYEEALRTAVEAELSETANSRLHIVPLSSGLDSRAILGALLDHPSLSREQIRTVTFGTPGTWDFELSQQVAERAGVKNTALDLTGKGIDWSVSALETYVQRIEQPIPVIEGYVNYVAGTIIDEEAVVWSGFLGDPTAGAHQPSKPANSWETACSRFVDSNRITDELSTPDFDPADNLPTEPYLPRSVLSFEEQLDIAHRQHCLIAPLVTPEPRRYRTPFLRTEWLSFALNLPPSHRQERTLFVEMVSEAFPELFAVGTDANKGLPLNASLHRELLRSAKLRFDERITAKLFEEYVHPNMNYLDFETELRSDTQLAKSVRELVSAFDKRDVPQQFDGDEIWIDHQRGDDKATELLAVSSAELWCRASDC
jgi:hypothetical protein